ncbi:MarR family winged helix-turn-helix transcriptional regulator [Brevibacillus ginsengisoli]|uniref:MarR family winged helix-turn-helix transcriptional regulator n=1 Tax=Brevibacillus ginsengisoli TaxID=363854 RepID=UPI003CED41C1
MNVVETIQEDVHKLTKLLHTLTSQKLSTMGITRPQALVIREVLDQTQTIGQISKAVDLSYSTVSGIIDRLEKNGYVQRTRDQEDRRVVWIDKTEKVKEIGKLIKEMHEQYYQEILSSVSKEELEAFRKTLQILTYNLEQKAIK